MLAIFLGNRLATIGDLEYQRRLAGTSTDFQHAGVLAIRNGIGDEVVEDPPRGGTIDSPGHRTIETLDPHLLLLQRQAVLGQYLLGHRCQVKTFEFERRLCCSRL